MGKHTVPQAESGLSSVTSRTRNAGATAPKLWTKSVSPHTHLVKSPRLRRCLQVVPLGGDGVSALKEETLRVPSLFPAEETARGQPAVNRKASPSQPSNLLATRSQTSGLQNCEK